MRILIVTQYFWPEPFPINELVRVLSEQGNEVDVYTGKPNYPDGETYSGYTADGFDVETFAESVSVYRTPLRPRGKGGTVALVRNYLSWVWHALRYSSRVPDKPYDLVLSYIPSPVTGAIPAVWIGWRRHIHVAIWVQDLWPDTLKAMGFIHNRALLALVGLMVRLIYSGAQTLLVQSRSFITQVARYASQNKIVYFANCSPDELAIEVEEGAVDSALLGRLEGGFTVVFTGNLGWAQSLETILDAASLIDDEDIRIVLVGSGSRFDWLREQVANRRLGNVLLAGRHPRHTMPAFYRRADALLVTLTGDEIFSYTVPSKLQTYMSAGVPILASLNGEGASIVEESVCGLSSPAEDSQALANNIRQLASLSIEESRAMGDRARTYFLSHFEVRRQAEKLVSLMQERIDGSSAT